MSMSLQEEVLARTICLAEGTRCDGMCGGECRAPTQTLEPSGLLRRAKTAIASMQRAGLTVVHADVLARLMENAGWLSPLPRRSPADSGKESNFAQKSQVTEQKCSACGVNLNENDTIACADEVCPLHRLGET